MMKSIKLRIIAAIALIAGFASAFIYGAGPNAAAANLSNFKPGNIISDAIFTNTDSMSVAQIQSFLESKVRCDTYGKKRSELGGGTRADWLRSKGYSTPIRCLTDYMENPSTGEHNYGKDHVPAGALSAAHLIHNYAKQFGINPQVLIVTLQKENGMVTDEWPTHKQFREAMGFGCPDHVAPGAPACDPSHGSLSAQLYQAARHFRGYMERPNGWYVPYGIGWNKILWHPNASCGSGDVYIENAATAALYSYTPYRPNQAALNAGYGRGDACSSYGNRNFYNYFSDWFGSTAINSSLLRSISNATVYLIGDGVKYPIASAELANSLASVLGNVAFVSDAYLDTFPTGPVAGRLIRSSNGTIYFYDSGIRLHFTSCDMIAHYGFGSGCGQPMQLTDAQVNRFYSGPPMFHGYYTTSGRRFYIENGQRREVFDDQSLLQSRREQGYNTLRGEAIQHLPIGEPVIRDNVLIKGRHTKDHYLFANTLIYQMRRSPYVDQAFTRLNSGVLDQESIARLRRANTTIDDHIASPSGTQYLVTRDGKKQLVRPGEIPSAPAVLPDQVISQLEGSGKLEGPMFVKSIDDPTVYMVHTGRKYPIVSMDDVFAIAGNSQPYIAWMSGETITKLPTNHTTVAPGVFVKSPTDATVYLSDGYDTLVMLSHFQPALDIGIAKNVRTVNNETVKSYKISDRALSPYVTCEGTTYLGVGGTLYKIELAKHQAFPLQPQTCRILKKENALPSFLLDESGTIFYRKDYTIHPIRSWQTFVALNKQNQPLVHASSLVISLFSWGVAL